jgi:CheY-like chemotaxis protein
VTGPLTGRRVLVVEDEILVAMMIEDLLERLGATVAGSAGSVEAALAALDGPPPDAAILDANLGGALSGPVARRLDALAVPFVVATGYVEHTLADPRLAGAPRLVKPFSDAAFEAAVLGLFASPPPDG